MYNQPFCTIRPVDKKYLDKGYPFRSTYLPALEQSEPETKKEEPTPDYIGQLEKEIEQLRAIVYHSQNKINHIYDKKRNKTKNDKF
jgi:hypothetical protein